MKLEPSLEEAKIQRAKLHYRPYTGPVLQGPRNVLAFGTEGFPSSLARIPNPPEQLYVIGDVDALQEGLAVIGARKATPYGRECAKRFAKHAAQRGIPIISGGAYGCDSIAHRAALDAGGTTVVFLGGGCDQLYPAKHQELFQQVIDSGGAVASERTWDYPALPFTFRMRNRLIAGLARATLIVEAGLPSGTFSTADEALAANRDVLVVPGAITSPTSAGSNRLLYQGAVPIVDDESFEDALCSLFGFLHQEAYIEGHTTGMAAEEEGCESRMHDPAKALLAALQACPMRMDEMMHERFAPGMQGADLAVWLNVHLTELQKDGFIERFPDGRYGPGRLPGR